MSWNKLTSAEVNLCDEKKQRLIRIHRAEALLDRKGLGSEELFTEEEQHNGEPPQDIDNKNSVKCRSFITLII